MMTMSDQVNHVLSETALERLAADAEAQRSLPIYRKGRFAFGKEETFEHPDIPPTTRLELEPDGAAADAENAARLYDSLGMLTETQASDIRFWGFLAHGPLIEYMRKRWPVGTDDTEAVAIARRRWLFHEDGRLRAITRNGLSRLWWGAHLTRAPWEGDPFFDDLKSKDPFRYTKLLFAYQDVFEGLFGRALGRDRHILVGVLEYLHQNQKLQKDRGAIRAFLRRLNMTCFHTLLGTVSMPTLINSFDVCARSAF